MTSELAFSLRSLRLSQSVCEFRNHTFVGINGHDSSPQPSLFCLPLRLAGLHLETRPKA